MSHPNKIAVLLSGGVDSSVALYLLKQTYPSTSLIGIHMTNWCTRDEESTMNCDVSEKDANDAEELCGRLDVPFQRVNFVKEYWNQVFEPFVDGILGGKTPNPDVRCNSEIKFGVMRSYAWNQLGIKTIATGHYARLWKPMEEPTVPQFLQDNAEETTSPFIDSIQKSSLILLSGKDTNKDQSYFLSETSSQKLQNVLFPLGEYHKNDGSANSVRHIASSLGLNTAKKKDSYGICFIGKRKFPNFIQEYIPSSSQKGVFICIDTGKVVGHHTNGSVLYTIGQNARISGKKQKWFVCGKYTSNSNVVWVCQGTHHPALYTDELYVKAATMNWILEVGTPKTLRSGTPAKIWARTRHLQPLLPGQIVWHEAYKQYTVKFDTPVRAITPGQTVAIYTWNGLVCLGGGMIYDRGLTYHEMGRTLPLVLSPSGKDDEMVKKRIKGV